MSTQVALSFIGQLNPDRVKARAIAPSIALPRPDRQGGIALMQALTKRRSGREFSPPNTLPHVVLSSLLWAAFGVNRPESNGRTAPTARDALAKALHLSEHESIVVAQTVGYPRD